MVKEIVRSTFLELTVLGDPNISVQKSIVQINTVGKYYHPVGGTAMLLIQCAVHVDKQAGSNGRSSTVLISRHALRFTYVTAVYISIQRIGERGGGASYWQMFSVCRTCLRAAVKLRSCVLRTDFLVTANTFGNTLRSEFNLNYT